MASNSTGQPGSALAVAAYSITEWPITHCVVTANLARFVTGIQDYRYTKPPIALLIFLVYAYAYVMLGGGGNERDRSTGSA